LAIAGFRLAAMPMRHRSREVPMLKRALVATLLGSAITLSSCDGIVEPTFGDTGVLSGGINQAGNGAFGRNISSRFEFLYPPVNNSCGVNPRCSLAESRSEAVGTLGNGGSPFMLLSTENTPVGFGSATIQTSGVRTAAALTIPTPAQYSALRLVLEWAFLTSRFAPATSNDSAIVRVKSGNDSAVVFRVTSADLQSGRFPQKSGGCGQFALFDRNITYGTCTDWQSSPDIDLTAWKDRTFELHFIVSEAAPVVAGVADSPSIFLFRRFTIEGGK
jgi:hypothetical protein